MFEFEVDHAPACGDLLPAEAAARFFQADVEAQALLLWEEHCTECAMPQCYGSCDLYQPRKDGKCRRFQHGFEYLPSPHAAGPIARVSFKRWGTVLAYGNLGLVPRGRAQRLTRWADRLADLVGRLPDGSVAIAGRRAPATRLARRIKRWLAQSALFVHDAERVPAAFVMEIYNPQQHPVNATFVVRDEGPMRARPFQELIRAEPGFNRISIPFAGIMGHIDPALPFTISLCPNLQRPEEEGLALYFGLMSFVAERSAGKALLAHTYREGALPDGTRHVKAVAWDLDNTVWKGILLEDGEAGLRLRPRIIDVMRELDRRGIINSIVSKNDPEVVAPLLQRFGIAEFVVFPKIGWMPKSESVLQLVKSLNIGADTVVVIDDSPFEREEISARCTGVRVFAETEYLDILSRPEFCPPLSAESSARRASYRAEEQRSAVAMANTGSYTEFLRQCQMTMHVRRVDGNNVARVHELIQRTNQLNFSGNRYTREQVDAFLKCDNLLPLSIACQDRFGDYGLVGFCLYDRSTQTVNDLMFSCRVQAKTVEHTFLRRLARYLHEQGIEMMKASYRKTPKNSQAAKVFGDIGFQVLSSDEAGVTFSFGLNLTTLSPVEEFVTVDWDLSA